jgi:hypothetical protein
MIFKLIGIELLKVRRSLALLMMLLCPLMVVVLTTLILLKSKRAMSWEMHWFNNTAIWSYFMFPLYISLVTGLLNGNEHKNGTWRMMLTLPISARQLYVAKLSLAGIFIMGANIALLFFIASSIFICFTLGRPIDLAFHFDMVRSFWVLSLCSLPILVIQHWVSWRLQNIVAPLAIGVVATMGITQIGQSKDWVYYPWSYTMMAMQGADAGVRSQAIVLALVAGLILFGISTFWVGRKGAEFQ